MLLLNHGRESRYPCRARGRKKKKLACGFFQVSCVFDGICHLRLSAYVFRRREEERAKFTVILARIERVLPPQTSFGYRFRGRITRSSSTWIAVLIERKRNSFLDIFQILDYSRENRTHAYGGVRRTTSSVNFICLACVGEFLFVPQLSTI